MVASTGHYEPVAREAFPYALVPAFIVVLFWWLEWPWLSLFFLAITICVLLFFRNPQRTSNEGPGLVLAPADGVVADIVPHAASEALDAVDLSRVSIFMSIFDVHVNRSPISGVVEKIQYRSGAFLDAREPDSSHVNERSSMVLTGDVGTIEVTQVAGKVARRISCWVREGQSIGRGQRFGLIHFGSRLDVYLPPEFTVTVTPGTRVTAGESIIAERRLTQD